MQIRKDLAIAIVVLVVAAMAAILWKVNTRRAPARSVVKCLQCGHEQTMDGGEYRRMFDPKHDAARCPECGRYAFHPVVAVCPHCGKAIYDFQVKSPSRLNAPAGRPCPHCGKDTTPGTP